LAKDYLSELFKSVYTDTVFEWKKQGLSDQDIINKLSQDTINDSLKAVLEQSAKDYRDFFVAKKFEIAHRQKIRQVSTCRIFRLQTNFGTLSAV